MGQKWVQKMPFPHPIVSAQCFGSSRKVIPAKKISSRAPVWDSGCTQNECNAGVPKDGETEGPTYTLTCPEMLKR